MTVGYNDAQGFMTLRFNNSSETVSPRNVNAITSQALEFRGVTGCSLFLDTTLAVTLNVTVEVACDKDGPFLLVGTLKAVTAPAGGKAVLDVDDLPKLKNDYPWIRFSIVPATAPAAGTLAGKFYREW